MAKMKAQNGQMAQTLLHHGDFMRELHAVHMTSAQAS